MAKTVSVCDTRTLAAAIVELMSMLCLFGLNNLGLMHINSRKSRQENYYDVIRVCGPWIKADVTLE